MRRNRINRRRYFQSLLVACIDTHLNGADRHNPVRSTAEGKIHAAHEEPFNSVRGGVDHQIAGFKDDRRIVVQFHNHPVHARFDIPQHLADQLSQRLDALHRLMLGSFRGVPT